MTTVKVCSSRKEKIVVWDSKSLALASNNIHQQIDEVGKQSAIAQGLVSPITSVDKILLQQKKETQLQLIYVLKEDDNEERILGFIKVGRRHLFLFKNNDNEGKMLEKEPLCVLDFFVRENHRRMGIGKKLFDAMMLNERIDHGAAELAYDRPSSNMVNFLRDKYGLRGGRMQPNKYIVFDEFWDIML